MTLPSQSSKISVDFNHNMMSNSLLENEIFQHRPNGNSTTLRQSQQHPLERQRLAALHDEQKQTTLQRVVQALQPPPSSPPLSSMLQQNITQQQLRQQPEITLETITTSTSTHLQKPVGSITTSAATTILSSQDLAIENVMPGIYLTKNFVIWNEENLRAQGFTHIIIIDKHIKELYYPSPVFKLSTENATVDAFDTYDEYISHPACSTTLKFGKEFEAIDLNFGEKSYLTTVLPNCYRAVKFINKALQGGGTILVIDCNGGEQKCITIIVAYLMYKHNIKFSYAFARLKDYYKKADLDRFYMTQLYEYEPILQVQRAQSRGQSCSREMHAAILKRKKGTNDVGGEVVGDRESTNRKSNDMPTFTNNNNITKTGTNNLFTTFNPLSNFKTPTTSTTIYAEKHFKLTTSISHQHTHQQQQQQQQHLKCRESIDSTALQHSSNYRPHQDLSESGVFNSAATTITDCNVLWDDNAME